jgi:hypothetical protein
MKIKLVFVTLVCIALFSFTISSFAYNKVKNENSISVVFNAKMNFDSLVAVKSELKEKGITIMYRSIEFDENNYLRKIDFFVDCNDGFKGSAYTDKLSNDYRFGFCRDYEKNTEVPFKIGRIN